VTEVCYDAGAGDQDGDRSQIECEWITFNPGVQVHSEDGANAGHESHSEG